MADTLRIAAEFYLALCEQVHHEAAFEHARQQFGIYDQGSLWLAIQDLRKERA
jgi:hypothetical protein